MSRVAAVGRWTPDGLVVLGRVEYREEPPMSTETLTDIYTCWAGNECPRCHAALSQNGDGNHKACTSPDCGYTYERVVAPGLNEFVMAFDADGVQVA